MSLLVLMLVKAWIIPMVYLDFELRRDYIVANLCVNRNRPQLHCDGKCYLAKKLAETKKQEESQAAKDYLASLIYQVMDTRQRFYFKAQDSVSEIPLVVTFNYTSRFAALLLADDIFHPPLG